MRFPIAALFFVITSFIFGVAWAVTSYLLTTVNDAMTPFAVALDNAKYSYMLNMLPWAFGVMCVIFFVIFILIVFVLDSLSDEPEYYYQERR